MTGGGCPAGRCRRRDPGGAVRAAAPLCVRGPPSALPLFVRGPAADESCTAGRDGRTVFLPLRLPGPPLTVHRWPPPFRRHVGHSVSIIPRLHHYAVQGILSPLVPCRAAPLPPAFQTHPVVGCAMRPSTSPSLNIKHRFASGVVFRRADSHPHPSPTAKAQCFGLDPITRGELAPIPNAPYAPPHTERAHVAGIIVCSYCVDE